MSLELNDRESEMLSGARGPAIKTAMSILARMAEVYQAPRLMPITGAHIDSTIYIGDAGLEYAERFVALGAKVQVPTTLNVSGLDEQHWQEWPVPQDWAEKSQRQMVAYSSMGTIPTWTCAPYQTEFKPLFGQQIAWGESNAIVFANSVIGARTERYPDLLDICCAITGLVPAFGLHLSENRAGQMLFRLRDVPADLQKEDEFYPVLGHLLGKIAHDRIPVLEGLVVVPTDDQLKALGAAAASSGSVALFHIVGVTPEAPSCADAFQGREPDGVIDVSMGLLTRARSDLTTAEGEQLHMVVLGSPHFSLAEFRQLAPLLEGKRVHPNVQFLVTSSRGMALLARQAGYLGALERFGGKLTLDTCILATPMLPPEVKTLMTNSAKYAYYAPGMLNTQVTFGSLADCVESAVEGRVIRNAGAWDDRKGGNLAEWPSEEVDRGRRLTADQKSRVVIPGNAEGELLVGPEPLSFWGGYDHRTGEIVDRRHPLAGQCAAGRILAVPFTRGSSTTTAVLLEAIRGGTAPAAILTTGVDSYFALASIVADIMYGKPIPLVALLPEEFAALKTGDRWNMASWTSPAAIPRKA